MSVCKHLRKDGICGLHSKQLYIELCHEGPCTDYVAMTNADKIRQISDEEMAEWIAEYVLNLQNNGSLEIAKKAWLDWLKQEMESE